MSFLVLLPARRERFTPPDDHGSIELKTRIIYEVHGGNSPTVFKTMRNAVKKASMYDDWEGDWADGKAVSRRRAVPGLVVKFDPGYLPIVLDPETASAPMLDTMPVAVPSANHYQHHWQPGGPKTLDEEYALAERQMLLWQERVVMLKAKLRTTE